MIPPYLLFPSFLSGPELLLEFGVTTFSQLQYGFRVLVEPFQPEANIPQIIIAVRSDLALRFSYQSFTFLLFDRSSYVHSGHTE
jgi:hypothetical protein